MKSAGIFLLVGTLTLWMAQPSWTGMTLPVQQILQVEPGTCPVVVLRCKMHNPPNRCTSDSQCAGTDKCCDTGCGLDCIPTQEVTVKAGTCPWIKNKCQMINPPNTCKKDDDCPSIMKCCMSSCGKQCMNPNPSSSSVKSGTCPVIPVKCKMHNPPNRCVSDSQCDGTDKCCETICGRSCVPPQQGKPGTCPDVRIHCAMHNPPNRCYFDSECPGFKKCCDTYCGKACVIPKGYGKGTSLILSFGSVLRSLPASAEPQLPCRESHFNPSRRDQL
ncbi:WAP four-disulfide core domain protein 8-like isoform X1 [Pelodiscus sinensis]|uniref:WAP four-disulfide core domain protein 8-like isoform X1 n=1 Tax=Pelodiscus sinensis TaxID=13735 RepID=UPI003F6CFCC2